MADQELRGTVFLAWDPSGAVYWGYWDLAPDGPPTNLEQFTPTRDVLSAVDWGRQRSPRVLIRPESDPGQYHWAGVTPPDGDYASLPIFPIAEERREPRD